MAFDAVDVFNSYRKGYERMRGTVQSPLSGEWYPNTSWGDVTVFYETFRKATNDVASCVVASSSVSAGSIISTLLSGPTAPILDPCMTYLKSSRFQSALKAWDAVSPMQVAYGKWGTRAPIEIGNAIVRREPYLDNINFWEMGERYAIARSAAGKVKGDFQRMTESIDEAIADLPATIKNAVNAVNPGNLLPDLGPLVELIKWGSILGGFGLLYWYVLRPKDKKKS